MTCNIEIFQWVIFTGVSLLLLSQMKESGVIFLVSIFLISLGLKYEDIEVFTVLDTYLKLLFLSFCCLGALVLSRTKIGGIVFIVVICLFVVLIILPISSGWLTVLFFFWYLIAGILWKFQKDDETIKSNAIRKWDANSFIEETCRPPSSIKLLKRSDRVMYQVLNWPLACSLWLIKKRAFPFMERLYKLQ